MSKQTIPSGSRGGANLSVRLGPHMSANFSLGGKEVRSRIQVMGGAPYLILAIGDDKEITLAVEPDQWRTIKATGDAALVEHAEAGAA